MTFDRALDVAYVVTVDAGWYPHERFDPQPEEAPTRPPRRKLDAEGARRMAQDLAKADAALAAGRPV